MKIEFDKEKIINKYYSTLYFSKTKDILLKYNNNNISTLQFSSFTNEPYMLCGIDECIQIIKTFLSPGELNNLEIRYRKDGDIILKNEPVLLIKGQYSSFCELENIIDSILARRSSVATNCWRMLQFLKKDELIFMSDRSDDYTLHPYDGYAAYVAGVRNFTNYSHIEFIKDLPNINVFGSMPHALIHQYKNNINKLLEDYLMINKTVTLLVDFSNDIISTLKIIDKKYYKKITAIRIDTSINMVDKSLVNKKVSLNKIKGVNKYLIEIVREYLDNNGLDKTKIIVTSNNTLKSIKQFKKDKSKIDSFGIGSALTSLCLHFTADLVELNNKKYAKKGRHLLSDSKMIVYK